MNLELNEYANKCAADRCTNKQKVLISIISYIYAYRNRRHNYTVIRLKVRLSNVTCLLCEIDVTFMMLNVLLHVGQNSQNSQ